MAQARMQLNGEIEERELCITQDDLDFILGNKYLCLMMIIALDMKLKIIL